MRRNRMTTPGLLAASLVLAMVLSLACGDEDTSDAAVHGTATRATTAGAKLSDCDYATTLVHSLETFTNSLPSVSGFRSMSDAIAAFEAFDRELGTLVSELTSYQLSSDVARVNTAVISIFEDARAQIPELKRAVESGDSIRLTQVSARLTQEILPRMDSIERENQGAMDKLGRCVEE
ncbi:MAG: hypothetical protein ACRDJE_14035 [Dehalococcoidia bacterium]